MSRFLWFTVYKDIRMQERIIAELWILAAGVGSVPIIIIIVVHVTLYRIIY